MRAMAKRKIGKIRSAEEDYNIAMIKIDRQNSDSAKFAIDKNKYRKIIELEANFNNNFIGDDKIYSVFSGIDPLPGFFINFNDKNRTYRTNNYRATSEIQKRMPESLILNIVQSDSAADYNKLALTIDSLWEEPVRGDIYMFLRGVIELGNKNFNSSLKAFTKAIEIDSNFALAYNNRAYTRLKMIDFINSIGQDIQISVDGQKKTA